MTLSEPNGSTCDTTSTKPSFTKRLRLTLLTLVWGLGSLALAVDQVHSGTLTRWSATTDDGCPIRWYPFFAQAGERVTIDLTSFEFDAYLYLSERPNDDWSSVIAVDDDGGMGLDSRIVHTVSDTGMYYVGASSFSCDTGSYTVTIRSESTNRVSDLYVQNDCSSPIRFAVRYQDASSQWRTASWWNYDGYYGAYPLNFGQRVRTRTPSLYFYAESHDGWDTWDGSHRVRIGSRDYYMRRTVLDRDSDGDWLLRLTCA